MSTPQSVRRDVLKKVAYITPLILTFAIHPHVASAGSGDPKEDNQKAERDKIQKPKKRKH
jgi:hypothetical protein